MFYYKLIIAYDGTDYHGWQWQPGKKTVAGQLEKSFYHAFRQKPLSLVAVSRTDSGVHAWGQVARVVTAFYIDPEKLKKAWQGTLPDDILLREITFFEADFDLHEGVARKTYDYYLSYQRVMPFISRYCAYYYAPFSRELLERNLQVFIGTHDFRSFCTGDDKENTVRTIESITVTSIKRYNLYRIRVQGPGFLRYMIRRIVGASLQMMSSELMENCADGVSFLQKALQEKNPHQKLKTAPARGLVLRAIEYRK